MRFYKLKNAKQDTTIFKMNWQDEIIKRHEGDELAPIFKDMKQVRTFRTSDELYSIAQKKAKDLKLTFSKYVEQLIKKDNNLK